MTTSTVTTLPGLTTGTWTIDPSHSEIGFVVRHMMVSKVKGHFSQVAGTITVAENVLDSSVVATVPATSINTRDDNRDAHLRSADFFDAENHPEVRFRSRIVNDHGGGRLHVEGELEAAGERARLQLDVTVTHADGGLELDATATVDQRQLGMTWSPLGVIRTPTAASVHARLRREQ